jgi:hypothetical protein
VYLLVRLHEHRVGVAAQYFGVTCAPLLPPFAVAALTATIDVRGLVHVSAAPTMPPLRRLGSQRHARRLLHVARTISRNVRCVHRSGENIAHGTAPLPSQPSHVALGIARTSAGVR